MGGYKATGDNSKAQSYEKNWKEMDNYFGARETKTKTFRSASSDDGSVQYQTPNPRKAKQVGSVPIPTGPKTGADVMGADSTRLSTEKGA